MEQTLALTLSYLLGSVSFGVLVARTQGIDIRAVGSGNTGTSNVMRVLGKKLGAVVLLGDATKGAIAAALGVILVDPGFGYITLFAAVVGHAFPIFHGFRGGKSVATALGGFIYLAPVVGIVLSVGWALILIIWKTASIGSLVVMVLVVPLLALVGRTGADLVWSGVIALFVLFRHSSNVRRLLTGSERRAL